MGGTSRVTGDSQARFWEGLGVKFPGPIRVSFPSLFYPAWSVRAASNFVALP